MFLIVVLTHWQVWVALIGNPGPEMIGAWHSWHFVCPFLHGFCIFQLTAVLFPLLMAIHGPGHPTCAQVSLSSVESWYRMLILNSYTPSWFSCTNFRSFVNFAFRWRTRISFRVRRRWLKCRTDAFAVRSGKRSRLKWLVLSLYICVVFKSAMCTEYRILWIDNLFTKMKDLLSENIAHNE